MRNYHVESGIVDAVVEPVNGFTLDQCFTPEYLASIVSGPDKVEIGWTYDGKKFSAPVPIEAPLGPVPTITPRQLRLWLLSRGLLAQVPTLIEAMPEPDKSVARIEWEFATVFDHGHPFMQALGAAVGLTVDEIKTGFREAAQL